METLRKVKLFVLKIWNDQVGSNVIAAIIVAGLAIGWAKITNHTWTDIYNYLIKALTFKLPVFVFLSLIALYFIAKYCIQLFKNKKDPIWDEQIGNYTFKELHNIMVTERFEIQTQGMEWARVPAPKDDLLTLFRVYFLFFNEGIHFESNMDDGGYGYSVLAPRLLGFGLVELYQKPLNNLPDQTERAYRTSELGYKFHALLDKVILEEKIKEHKKGKSILSV